MKRSLFFLMGVLLLACTKDKESDPDSICYTRSYPPRNNEKVTIDQGIWGDVWFWEGDFMPFSFGTICQVQRTISVFEKTTTNNVIQALPYSPFYSAINTKLVATTESDENGFFQVELDTGTYSLFVSEDTLYYSNLFDGYGTIFPVKIESRKVKDVRFDISYKALY